MKLDATIFRYMTKEEFRTLTAIEMGMRNHELVPVPLIESIAKLNRGGTYKLISTLLKHKLIAHENKAYDGYRLTYKGFDFLALRAMAARGTLSAVGRRLGVGKESDVHFCQGPNGETYALKLHRLGRISFRAVKSKRDYMQHRTHGSWMYMARLAALKEFAYMKALHDEGFPVPTPVDQNRHCVVMSMVDAVPMVNIRDLPKPHLVLERLMRLVIRLGRAGIVHSDFNEFNLMIDSNNKITLIDFPQIVHINHPNAREFFDRDVRSICEYFRKKNDLIVEEFPTFDQVLAEVEADGGAVMTALNVQGISRDDNDLLVAAHGNSRSADPYAKRSRGDDEEEDDEESEDEESGQKATEDLAGLVPEDGHRELGEFDDEADGPVEAEDAIEAIDTPAFRAGATDAANEGGLRVWPNEEPTPDGDAEGSGDDQASDSGQSDYQELAPGQVAAPKNARKKKAVHRPSATEARKNLQRQQKVRPAKANNSKVRDLRRAKHEVKEHFM